MKVLIHGGRLVDPSQGIDDACDLLVGDDGRVEKVGRPGQSLKAGKRTERFDATGMVVSPGLIDIHVHLREPGEEYKETVETGTRAAAAGGFTAVACMPNTRPVNDGPSVTEHILEQARRWGYARVYPIGAVSKGQKGEQLAEIGEMAAAGVVAVSDDGLPISDPELMRRALEYCRHYDLPLIQHAEDLGLTRDGVMHEGEWSTRLGLPGIPGAAEDVMVARDLLLLEETGGRYHVAHLSTARSLELVRRAKAAGLRATCEVTPHHLLLTDREIAERGFSTDCKMKPPLRSESDREALFLGVVDGTVDVIASDHAPHLADEKELQFSVAPFGIVGLESTLPLCLDRLVRPRAITLSRLVDLLSTAPARLLGIPGGSLAPGCVADVTAFSLDRQVTIRPDRFKSKGRSTPFDGWKLRGRPVATFLAGRRVTV